MGVGNRRRGRREVSPRPPSLVSLLLSVSPPYAENNSPRNPSPRPPTPKWSHGASTASSGLGKARGGSRPPLWAVSLQARGRRRRRRSRTRRGLDEDSTPGRQSRTLDARAGTSRAAAPVRRPRWLVGVLPTEHSSPRVAWGQTLGAAPPGKSAFARKRTAVKGETAARRGRAGRSAAEQARRINRLQLASARRTRAGEGVTVAVRSRRSRRRPGEEEGGVTPFAPVMVRYLFRPGGPREQGSGCCAGGGAARAHASLSPP